MPITPTIICGYHCTVSRNQHSKAPTSALVLLADTAPGMRVGDPGATPKRLRVRQYIAAALNLPLHKVTLLSCYSSLKPGAAGSLKPAADADRHVDSQPD